MKLIHAKFSDEDTQAAGREELRGDFVREAQMASPGASLVRGKLLIVDDDVPMAESIAQAMSLRGFSATWKSSATAALHLLEVEDFDVVVTDLHMEGMDGLAFCELVVATRPDMPVVVITAFGSMQSAVAAIRAGAYDFITKPCTGDALDLVVTRALQHRVLRTEVKRLRQEVNDARGVDHLVGSSLAIERVKEVIGRISDSEATLLITGESGTGKELIAQTVHQRSRNSDGPFIAINCAAVPETLLESELFGHVKGAFTDARTPRQGLFLKANGGTLFLDEVGEMPSGMQPKLLRALQEKTIRPLGGDREIPYHARIITASNRDLEREVAEGRFREDLFYRINVVRIEVPSLRARGDDVLILAQHFVAYFSKATGKNVRGISQSVAAKLLGYGWPGNVRELQNCIQRAVVFARFDELTVDDLPERLRNYKSSEASIPGFDAHEILTLDEVDRRYTIRMLEQLEGNKTEAAHVLGVDRRTLHRKLGRWEQRGDRVE